MIEETLVSRIIQWGGRLKGITTAADYDFRCFLTGRFDRFWFPQVDETSLKFMLTRRRWPR